MPAQHLVPVRETAEAANDLLVDTGPAERVRVGDLVTEPDAELLVDDRFRMGERKIEERAEGRVYRLVEPRVDGASGDPAGFLVLGKSLWRAPVEVSRELVEQKEKGERSF